MYKGVLVGAMFTASSVAVGSTYLGHYDYGSPVEMDVEGGSYDFFYSVSGEAGDVLSVSFDISQKGDRMTLGGMSVEIHGGEIGGTPLVSWSGSSTPPQHALEYVLTHSGDVNVRMAFSLLGDARVSSTASVGDVPLPAAFWLFASGVVGLGLLGRKRFSK